MQTLDFDTKKWATIQGGMSRLVQGAANLVGRQNISLNSPVRRIIEGSDNRITWKPAVQSLNPRRSTQSLLPSPLLLSKLSPKDRLGNSWRSNLSAAPTTNLCTKWVYTSVLASGSNETRPSFGGQSMTDLRLRWIVYPSNDLGAAGSGVLLLYSWMTDVSRWQTLSRDERLAIYWQTNGQLGQYCSFWKIQRLAARMEQGRGSLNGRGQAAWKKNRESIVQLLIENGADVQALYDKKRSWESIAATVEKGSRRCSCLKSFFDILQWKKIVFFFRGL